MTDDEAIALLILHGWQAAIYQSKRPMDPEPRVFNARICWSFREVDGRYATWNPWTRVSERWSVPSYIHPAKWEDMPEINNLARRILYV